MNILLLTSFLFLSLYQSCDGKLFASGGGIIVPGSELILRNEMTEIWDRCYWYHYGQDDKSKEFCSFNNDPLTGKGQVHRCKPSNWTILEYVGSDPKICAIKIVNGTASTVGGYWASRVDDDTETQKINVSLASKVTSLVIEFGNERDYLVAESLMTVQCTAKGGNPQPNIKFNIGDVGKGSNITMFTESREDGTTIANLSLTPNVNDDGKVIGCSSVQMDKDPSSPKPLFEGFESANLTLNVTYGPQVLAHQKIVVNLGETANLSITFVSNPKPEYYSWLFNEESLNKSEKYNMSEIYFREPITTTTHDLNNKFTVSLQIYNCSYDDEGEYGVELSNAFGTQIYNFTIRISGHTTPESIPSTTTSLSTISYSEPSTTVFETSTEEEPDNSNGPATIIIPIIVCLVVIGVIICFLIYAKRKRNSTFESFQLR